MSDLHRLVFTSRSALRGDADEWVASVGEVVTSSKRNNVRAGITSVLAIHDHAFAQVLEGPRDAVATTFSRIRRDPRHTDIRVLQHEAVRSRGFGQAPMALVGHSRCARALLDGIVDRGGRGLAHAGIEALTDALRAIVAGEAHESGGTLESGETFGTGGEQAPADLPPGGRAGKGSGDALPASSDTSALATEGGTPVLSAVDEFFATSLISADGRVLRANANFLRLFGYGPDEVAGLGCRALVSPEDANHLDDLWAGLRRGESRRTEYLGLRKDGTEIWVKGNFNPRMGADGRLRDVQQIASDISTRQRRAAEEGGQVEAINTSQAVIHFGLDGVIQSANRLFLDAVGYRLDEVAGRHHRMFVDPVQAESADYAAFWADLAAGRHRSGEYKRLGKDGREIWLQATYNPIFDRAGRPFKVVKYATDVTAEKLEQADYRWQVTAIHKSHAVITFDIHGVVLDANDAFLDAVGYGREEVVGRHHRMFIDPSYAHGAEYATFWRDLGRGCHQAGQYRRLGRNGKEVWLQATYNPVFDMEGRPVKVVKYATVVTQEKLRQAEHQGQIAAIHKAQCVVSFDLDGKILDANDNFLALTGYRLSEVRGRPHRLFVEPEEAASAGYAAFWADLAAGRHRAGEYKRLGRDGREVWLQATYNPIFDMAGRPFKVVKYATDVTADKLQQADYQGQIDAICKSQGVITFAMDGTILDANATVLDTLGYGIDEVRGRHHRMLVEPGTEETRDYEAFWDTLRQGTFLSGMYKRVGKGGKAVWIQASYNPILDLNGRPFKVVKFATDVTSDVALAEAYEDAKRQAQHDSATALPNRVRLASFMAAALAHPGARLAVLYIDLDRFKPINDAFGHHVGDRVLGEVADRLRRTLGNDQIAARVGGDEFVVAAPDLPDEEIELLCQRLMTTVGAPIRHDGGELKVEVSIGVAVSPSDAATPDDLLRCADVALYRSKQHGRGTFSFYANDMNDRLHAYRSTVDEMRHGLDEGEFFVEYQPRFDVRTQTIRSVEALVRWCHPERGRISPADFIPLAERSGLIVQLGEWVLRTACEAAAGWSGIGVSVNVSPLQFRDSDLIEVVTAALRATALDPHRLELEITEGVLLENAERARAALDGLKALGVRLAMDDFGTGYSSLSSLRSFPFDTIKIDRQFIADMSGRDGGREVVQAILGLGRALGLSVTAEGVETAGQLKMLAADRCEEAQGFLLARPMAASKIADLLAEAGGHPMTA